jgi:hypothetical protein
MPALTRRCVGEKAIEQQDAGERPEAALLTEGMCRQPQARYISIDDQEHRARIFYERR